MTKRNENPSENQNESTTSRRSFLKSGAALGAGAMLAGMIPSGGAQPVQAQTSNPAPTAGDIAILKFLAAAELVEDDLWQQYSELATNNPRYRQALEAIDPALIRYINDDRDDERSHALLINAYLTSIGQTPVNLDAFRTLPSARAMGAQQTGRLTNLTNLTVDTSWYNRYRGIGNPDLGDTFPQLVNIVNRPTIPTTRQGTNNDAQIRAHSAAFHFGAIEQGGASLYLSLMPKVTNLDVLAILTSIGPVELYHFATFHKSLERIFGIQSSDITFPDLRSNPNLAQAVMPEPCKFLNASFPLCSVIRPRNTANAGAVAAATGLVQSGLFQGQPQSFFDAVVGLATAADAATRTL